MSHLKRIQQTIQGWLPKEPILPSRASTSPMKPNRGKSLALNLALSLLAIIGLMYVVASLSNSWIKIWLIGACLVAGGLCLVSRGQLRKASKVALVAAMIFSVSFTAVEGYLLWNGGYPATYTPTQPTVTLTLQKMLNTSVEQIVQSAEDSTTFALLKLEHGSNITFQSMNLSPSDGPGGYIKGGYISVDFASTSSNTYFHCYSADGHQYIIQPTTYNGELLQYPSQQTIDVALKQIDALGLNWFYNQALEIAQNRTLNLPSVDSVVVTLAFGEGPGSYQGLTLQLIGYHQTVQPNGSINGDGVLISEFQPNGTLIYMSKPAQL